MSKTPQAPETMPEHPELDAEDVAELDETAADYDADETDETGDKS